MRIWGHWTAADGSIDDYAGSAGGNDTYSGGQDWVELTHTWTVAAEGPSWTAVKSLFR